MLRSIRNINFPPPPPPWAMPWAFELLKIDRSNSCRLGPNSHWNTPPFHWIWRSNAPPKERMFSVINKIMLQKYLVKRLIYFLWSWCWVLNKDGVSMSIEMWFISNSNNVLLQSNKAEIGFIHQSSNYIAVVKKKDKLKNSRAYIETF